MSAKTYIRPNLTEKERATLLALLSQQLSAISFAAPEFKDLFSLYSKLESARVISTATKRG